MLLTLKKVNAFPRFARCGRAYLDISVLLWGVPSTSDTRTIAHSENYVVFQYNYYGHNARLNRGLL